MSRLKLDMVYNFDTDSVWFETHAVLDLRAARIDARVIIFVSTRQTRAAFQLSFQLPIDWLVARI